MHVGFGSWGTADRSIKKMNEVWLLGPDLNLIHVNSINDEEYNMIAYTGASVSVTPEVEMMKGHGYPFTRKLTIHDGRPTIGIDIVTSTGGDMFVQMKFTLLAERSRINEIVLQRGEMPKKLQYYISYVGHKYKRF